MAREDYTNGRSLDANSATNTHPEAMDPRDLDQGVQEQPVTRMPAPEGDRPETSDGHEMKRYKKDDLRKSSDVRQGSLGEVADIVGERDKVTTKNVAREMAESREVNEADALIDHRERHDERCATQMGEEARLNLSRRPGETLEQYETRLAEQRVHQDDHETAKRADFLNVDRAASSRETLAADDFEDTVVVDGAETDHEPVAEAVSGDGGDVQTFTERAEAAGEFYTPIEGASRDEAWTDPRADLDSEAVAELNAAALEMADEVPGHSRVELARRGARRIKRGADPRWAVIEAAKALKDGRDGIRALESLETWMAGYSMTVDVEVTVDHLYNPMSDSQYQVAMVTDTSTSQTYKFTIWRDSIRFRRTGQQFTLGTDQECDNTIPRLREGDVIRAYNLEVGAYKGQPTLALTQERNGDIHIVERGDGPERSNHPSVEDGIEGQSPKACQSPSETSGIVSKNEAAYHNSLEAWTNVEYDIGAIGDYSGGEESVPMKNVFPASSVPEDAEGYEEPEEWILEARERESADSQSESDN